MKLSPKTAARRLDRLIGVALAVSLLLQALLLLVSGRSLAPWAVPALAGAAVAGWLLWRHSGSVVSAWGLSLLLTGSAVLAAWTMPERPGLMLMFPVALSLLPSYRRWPLVVLAGAAMAAAPLALQVAAQPGGLLIFALMLLAQTAFLAIVAQRNDVQARAQFDVDFLVRAMGEDGPIRLDLAVLRAETAVGERLKQAQERMAATLLQVRSSAQSAAESARQLQDNGQALAQRSQHAGGELGAAAMTLTQIAVIVKESANAAMTARETAQAATAMAEQGGRIVGLMVDQMRAIDAASRRITDIIGVIEGIAFQTNMLALNAAVEAARAGEQGRGFAVVAGEVRSLAQRASSASGEVKSLVDDTVAAVSRGNELARQVGKTMTDLTGTVSLVDQTFHSLSADTNEHAAGIEAIRDTMNELNEATQRNLEMAEQSRGIADELAARAAALNDSLAGFRLGDAAAEGASPAARADQVLQRTRNASRDGGRDAGRDAASPAPAAGKAAVEFF